MADPPEAAILLLGDAEVGKSSFLSYVIHVFCVLISCCSQLLMLFDFDVCKLM